MEQPKTKEPVQKYRMENIQLSVWENETKEQKSFSKVSLQNTYFNKDTQKWQETNSYSFGDLLKLKFLIEKAFEDFKIREAKK